LIRVEVRDSKLDAFTWWRLAHMLRARNRWNWGQARRHLKAADGAVGNRGGRSRALPDPGRDGLPLCLPGEQDPEPLATCEPRLTAAAAESPLLSNGPRRVRRAVRGNGPVATPEPRPGPTQQVDLREPCCLGELVEAARDRIRMGRPAILPAEQAVIVVAGSELRTLPVQHRCAPGLLPSCPVLLLFWRSTSCGAVESFLGKTSGKLLRCFQMELRTSV